MLNSKWWEGPIWLKENPESWPVSEVSSQPSEVDNEMRKCKIVNMNLTEDTHPWYAERASDYDKMIRVFAWVLRFINNCKLVNVKCKNNELSQSEFEISEKKLICLVQSQYLSNAKFLNSVVTFVDDEGILRVKTKKK
ncbi:integrase_H2C2 domain-containing protein [Nephila pilipes]|uniref:Integrase_H2C2 domain-containing protein n=1 Tax=Nephila pilipes TaxID=299642 RepID=A0A8X6TGA8_NEPPI|nr:integrase_H2C2 domain-containing protein [Nephila pilipes]